MFLTENIIEAVTVVLAQHTGAQNKLQVVKTISGGSINQCFQIKYCNNLYFLKINSSIKFPAMFMAEAEGLKRIELANAVNVPAVIGYGNAAHEKFLILEWIEEGDNTAFSQQKLGRALALLHQHSNSQFGLDHNNYMGSLPQSNTQYSSWTDFFIYERLKPQVEIGRAKGFLNQDVLKQFGNLYEKLDTLYPKENPSLVHGDLWSGNYMIDKFNTPVLIDPAIFYANREVDIAMTMLFGGFPQSFYEAYNEVFPLQDGWKARIGLWNLYPLLIHLNLFGSSYLPEIKEILKRIS